MLTADIKVNGKLIGQVHIVNQDKQGVSKEEHAKGWRAYKYTYKIPPSGPVTGEVLHFRDNGAAALLKEVFEDIETKGGR